MAKPLEELTFEEAFERLEAVVRRLESGEAKLDESLSLFEEGVKLARACSRKLDAAEGKVKLLLEEEGGALREESLDDLPGAASS